MNSYTRVLGYLVLTATSAVLLSACVVRARAPGVYVSPGVTTTVVAQPAQTTYVQTQPAYAQPVVAACGACQQGTFERCNGCDDNCNGVIDEDCR